MTEPHATPLVDHASYLHALAADAARLAAVADGRLELPVPSCPGWSVADLVDHVAEVYEHKTRCIVDGRFPATWPPEPTGRPVLDRFTEAHAALQAELAGREPGSFAETWWWDERTVGFWARRMAQETVIHRLDAELAAGEVSPVDPALAVDGVDEVLRRFLSGDWSHEPVPDAAGATVHVVTDGWTWRVVLEPSVVYAQVLRPFPPVPEPAATVQGEPAALLAWLWGRGGTERLVTSGTAGVVDALRARLARAT